jgi:hypothetical protein
MALPRELLHPTTEDPKGICRLCGECYQMPGVPRAASHCAESLKYLSIFPVYLEMKYDFLMMSLKSREAKKQTPFKHINN